MIEETIRDLNALVIEASDDVELLIDNLCSQALFHSSLISDYDLFSIDEGRFWLSVPLDLNLNSDYLHRSVFPGGQRTKKGYAYKGYEFIFSRPVLHVASKDFSAADRYCMRLSATCAGFSNRI